MKISRRILMKLNSSMRCCNCCSCCWYCCSALGVMVLFLILLFICKCNNVMIQSAAFAAASNCQVKKYKKKSKQLNSQPKEFALFFFLTLMCGKKLNRRLIYLRVFI